MKKNNFTFIGCDSNFKNSNIVLFGAPFDGTTSFKPGARFAPNCIREDSWAIESYSPKLDKDLQELNIYDYGDIDIPFGNTKQTLKKIRKLTTKIINNNKKPIMIGGEHLVTLGSIQSLVKKYPNLKVIHFDAHTDLRDKYIGQKLSHATVLRRIYDLLGNNSIYQFYIRSGLKSEFLWAKEHTYLEKYSAKTLSKAIEKISDDPVYITIDLDVLDPSIFCGTGTPEPGGISFNQLLKSIYKMQNLKNVVGCDIVELAPKYDQSGVSTAVASKVLRELILSVF